MAQGFSRGYGRNANRMEGSPMMYVAKCKLDDRGRLTLPKSFMEANDIDKCTAVYISTMYNTDSSVKMVFVNGEEDK
jgi:bifunctional DNA-binding transcriptional regulator/antitoxin component of YhaV-PrlF toxin-antitoxin module